MAASTDAGDSGPFSGLPEAHHGWRRVESEDSLFEFWRRDSNHINGVYDQLRATATTDDKIRLSKTVYDQFGHVQSTERLTARATDNSDWVWKMALRQMERFPGSGDFDSPPAMPEHIGQWTLSFSGPDNENRRTTEWSCGPATIAVKEIVLEVHYSYTRRSQDLIYQEHGEEPHVIGTEIPRTSAYEIAVAIMEALPRPASQLQSRRQDLQKMAGIGPAKSKQLVLLGISTQNGLARAVDEDSEIPVNHHHRDALEKPLTSRIEQQLEDIRNPEQGKKPGPTRRSISASSQSGGQSDAE